MNGVIVYLSDVEGQRRRGRARRSWYDFVSDFVRRHRIRL